MKKIRTLEEVIDILSNIDIRFVLNALTIDIPKKFHDSLGKTTDLHHFITCKYCCNDEYDKVNLNELDKILFSNIDNIKAYIILRITNKNLKKFKESFNDHLVNQTDVRLKRFNSVTKRVMEKCIDLDLHTNFNDLFKDKKFNKIIDIFDNTIRKNSLSYAEQFKKGLISESEMLYLIERKRIKDNNLCSFKNEEGTPSGKCTHPGGNTKCGVCSVAAGWEIAFG